MKIDYKKIGFKSGLEIHQQLDTKKLFCDCDSVLRKDFPDFEVRRRLHVVAGESGEVDVAAKHEIKQNKEFVYQGYDTTCLVELDEEPPHKINQSSLKIALQICILLNCKIIQTTQIMRKTVLNGSNTSGFQRTVMIARDGYLETSEGRVGVDAVFLEEDSARPVSRDEKVVIYKIDRLGIPLVEIATAPDVKNAEHAKETALKIGEILRSCKVRRGIGTIRQDINISIKGSNRVELKGFQDPKVMIKTVEKEVDRQKNILKTEKTNKSEVRNVLPNGDSEFLRPMPSAARMYPETDLPLLKISRYLINEAKKDLPKLLGDIEEDLKSKGLTREMIKTLFKLNLVQEFRDLFNVIPRSHLIAKILLMFPKEIAKKKKIEYGKVYSILEDYFVDILNFIKDGKIKEEDVKYILEKIIDGKSLKSAMKFEKIDSGDIEEKIMKIIKGKPGLNPNAYMGLVMKEFKGKISGKEVMNIIERFF